VDDIDLLYISNTLIINQNSVITDFNVDTRQVYTIHINISNNTILANYQCITGIKQACIIHIKISNNTITDISSRKLKKNRQYNDQTNNDLHNTKQQGRCIHIIHRNIKKTLYLISRQINRQALKKQGAVKVVAYCTHPVLSGRAIENLRDSVLDELVVTDTIPLSKEAAMLGKIRQLSVADMLAETIRRIAVGESVSSLYVD
jgi:hypothetical protein